MLLKTLGPTYLGLWSKGSGLDTSTETPYPGHIYSNIWQPQQNELHKVNLHTLLYWHQENLLNQVCNPDVMRINK